MSAPDCEVVVDEDGPITRITLNRPERRNALSLSLMTELASALRAASGRVVVLAGNGPCFSAGHDLSEMRGRALPFYSRLFEQCVVLMDTIHTIPQPVIAKVHGVATAAGCQLAASCDLVVADEGARFATPGVNIGLFCSTPMVALTRAIGRKQAMRMLLTGEFVDALTAERWGLVNEVVPADALDAAVDELATKIAAASTLTIGLGKAAFYRQVDLDERQAYDLTKATMTANALAADAQEGIGAFLDKRHPTWTDG